MSNVVRIRRKEKEQEKKQLLSLITMDEFLLSKQKDDIVAEVNSILMDEWNPEEEFDVWAFGELVDRVMVSGDAVKVVLADENGRESA